ncbi:peptidase A24 [Halobacteriales archaeon SW_7_71_33]|nr:MAG: peptidase A24 [Halobacteriales archaeon SW_7_71_33]
MDIGVVVDSGRQVADALRLAAVPVFVWAAYRDVRTRRVPGRAWYPLVALGAALLVVEAAIALGDPATRRLFLVRAGLSLGFVVPLAYLFWRIAGFGGADAKAVMTLALLFPTAPQYLTTAWPQSLGAPGSLPVVEARVGVFAFTVLTNAVVAGAVYPFALVARNVVRGDRSPIMFLGRPVAVERLPERYGRLLERADGSAGRGLDLDALRMYLRWRGLTLADLRADPERYRDPASLPDSPDDPGDGAVTDGGVAGDPGAEDDTARAGDGASEAHDDPWGAAAFLEDIEGTAYGTSAADLRDGLELVADAERVWVSPGLPFMVPLCLGLLVGLTYGDVFVGLLSLTGVL